MVGIVVVSHSCKVAEGVVDLAKQMSAKVPMIAAGGTKDKEIGTDVEKIIDAINQVYSDDGVAILFDLGSALMNAEMAIECIDEDKKNKVIIMDAALLEGTIIAAVESGIGRNLKQIEASLKSVSLNKI
jgi:dihydroxyacetone kinase phosphotransfer subunit